MSENGPDLLNPVLKHTPTLCFGTFFLLVCQSRNNLGTRKRDRGNPSQREVAEVDVFNALMRIVYGNSNFSEKSNNINSYKQCRRKQKVPCQEATVLEKFEKQYHDCKQYKKIIDDVTVNLLSLLDANKDEQLVHSIVALIATSVEGNGMLEQVDKAEKFKISPTETVDKLQLTNEQLSICLPYFLLDVYKYVLTHCPNNMIGHETYEAWCPRVPGVESNSQRPLRHGPDLSFVKYIPKVYRNVEELQVPQELNTSLLHDGIQNKEVSASQASSFDAVQVDADPPISGTHMISSESGQYSQAPTILMLQRGKSSQAIGHVDNLTINIS